MTRQRKLLEILIALTCDSSFQDYIEREYHFIYTDLRELYKDCDSDDWVAEMVDLMGDHIDIVYKEWENYF